MFFNQNKNSFLKIFLVLFLLYNFLNFNLFSAFDSYKYRSQNTRARGMGSSYVALSDDAGAMFYNNAGLAFVQNPEIYLSYSKLFDGLDEDLYSGYSSFILPTKKFGTFGISYNKFSADIYDETVLNFSYGKKIFENLSFGLGGYFLSHSYDLMGEIKNDPVFSEKDNKDAYSLNLGIMYKLNNFFTLGFSGYNLNRPDVGIKNKDLVYDEYVLGVCFRYKTLAIPVDLSYRNQDFGSDKDKVFASIGFEKNLFQNFAIRFGMNDYEYSLGFSLLEAGFFDKINLGLDYSFSFPKYIHDELVSHQISLSFKFGDLIGEDDNRKYVLNTKDGVNPKFKIREGMDGNGNVVELLFDDIIIYKFYNKDIIIIRENAMKFARALSSIMNNEVLTDSSIFLDKEKDGNIYVNVNNLLKIPVPKGENKEQYEKNADVLLNKIKYILIFDWNKNQPISNISRRIRVKKGRTATSEIGIIFIDNEPIFNIYTTYKGKKPYDAAIYFAQIINTYLSSPNHKKVLVSLDRKYENTIFLDKQKLFDVSKDASFLNVNSKLLANQYLKKLKEVFDK